MVPPVPKISPRTPTLQREDGKKRSRRKTKISQSSGEKSGSRNAARERYRVRSLRQAFQSLQGCLPSVPPSTKLSKLDVLILATTYISHLSRILVEDELLQNENGFPLADIFQMDGPLLPLPEVEARNPRWEKSYLHPVKKWPMRSRLYAGVEENDSNQCLPALQARQWC